MQQKKTSSQTTAQPRAHENQGATNTAQSHWLKKFYFTNLPIHLKFINPTATIIFIFMAIAALLLNWQIERVFENNFEHSLVNEANQLEHDLNFYQNEALLIASGYTAIPGLENSYNQTNETQGRAALRQIIEPFQASLSSALPDRELKIHFHKSPAISFLRTWMPPGHEREGGDDLSAFRKSIVHLSQTKKAIKTIEVGRVGLVIRGIAPIMRNGRYLGSVESLIEFNKLYEIMPKGRYLSILVKDEYGALIDKSVAQKQTNGSLGDYYLVQTSHDSIPQYFNSAKLNTVNDTTQVSRHGDFLAAYIPLKDYRNEKIGVMILSQDMRDYLSELQYFRTLILFLTLLILTTLTITLYIVAKKITRPIHVTVSHFRQLAEGSGDLTARLTSAGNDEIGQIESNFNKFILTIANIVSGIKKSSDANSKTSAYLTDLSQKLSSAAQNQASSAEQSSAAIEEISSSMEVILASLHDQSQNAEANKNDVNKLTEASQSIDNSMKQLANIATDTVSKVATGGDSMMSVTDSMNKIGEHSDRIKQFVNNITDISDQTNLLALNAAIEAARAGESGRGFAVVADEISKLSDKTVTTVKEITKLIAESASAIDQGNQQVSDVAHDMVTILNAVNSMQQFIKKVVAATEDQTMRAGKIRERATNVTNKAFEIEQAISEQKSGMGEMNEFMQVLAHEAQDISEKSTDLQTMVDDLNKVSASLLAIVAKFRV